MAVGRVFGFGALALAMAFVAGIEAGARDWFWMALLAAWSVGALIQAGTYLLDEVE